MEVEKKDPAVRMGFLYEELETGRLTLAEYQKECAYWLLEDEPWRDFNPLDIPAKPADYEAWESMSEEDRKGCDKLYYQKHPAIMLFVGKVTHAWGTNLGRIDYLIFLKKHLLAEDKEAHGKFYYKVKEYITKLNKINAMRKMFDGSIAQFEEFKQGIIDKCKD